MPATGMDHFTVLTDALDATVEFYGDLLGIVPGARPPFPFPGAWLYCGAQPVLHIIALDSLPEQRMGVLDHMAFSATGLRAALKRLADRGLEYDLRRREGSTGQWQLFFFDPNGARVEMDFAEDEPA